MIYTLKKTWNLTTENEIILDLSTIRTPDSSGPFHQIQTKSGQIQNNKRVKVKWVEAKNVPT